MLVSMETLHNHFIYFTDINECLQGGNNCDSNATCNNTIGGFSCSCNIGYYGDGVTCTGM